MKNENKNYIDEFVNSLITIDTVKLNLKSVKENILYFEIHGEEAYRREYKFSNYSLDELKYYKKQLRKRMEVLKHESEH